MPPKNIDRQPRGADVEVVDLTGDDVLEALEALAKKPKPEVNMAVVRQVQRNAREHRGAEEWRNYKRRRPEAPGPRRSPSPDEMGEFLKVLSKADEQERKKHAADNARIRKTLKRLPSTNKK